MIVDYEYEVNTGEDLLGTIETEKLKGTLKAVILCTDRVVRLSINFKEYPTIRLLKLEQLSGERFVALRSDALDSVGDRYNYQTSEFVLNDTILITTSGPRNTKTKIIFRMESETR